jgi:hypothetical protein
MSFDRPGLPHPGHKGDEVEIDDDLREEGVELTDGDLDSLDRPGGVSRGPEPNPPRRPPHRSPAVESPEVEAAAARAAAAAGGEPVDDPAHDDPAHHAAHHPAHDAD